MQFSGTGGTENKSAAIEQFKKLASEGYAPAQYTLGYLNLKGDGIPQNSGEARFWFEKAAAKNDVRATAALAWLYLKGVGAPIDEKKPPSCLKKLPIWVTHTARINSA